MDEKEAREEITRRLDYLRELVEVAHADDETRLGMTDPDTGETYDDPDRIWDQVNELPLSIEQDRIVRVVIATGGPHEEIRFRLVGDDDLPISAEYLYLWAGVTVTRQLDDDDMENLWDLFDLSLFNLGGRL